MIRSDNNISPETNSSSSASILFCFIRFLLPFLLALSCFLFARHSARYYDSVLREVMKPSTSQNQYENRMVP